MFKIDSFAGHQNGKEFLNLAELGTDVRMSNKYGLISQTFFNIQQQQQEAEKRDWLSVLEAIERDIASLNNDFKFKKLVDKVDSETKDQ